MCTEVAVGLAVAGTAYNVYQGIQAGNAASAARSAQQGDISALHAISEQEWKNYKANMEPLAKRSVAIANETIPVEESENRGAVAATQRTSPLFNRAAVNSLAAGRAPTSGAGQAALRDTVTNSAITEASTRMGARQAGDDTSFSRRLGVMATGRGIPNQVMQGYGRLAQQQGQVADTYGQTAGNDFMNAIRWSGIGR